MRERTTAYSRVVAALGDPRVLPLLVVGMVAVGLLLEAGSGQAEQVALSAIPWLGLVVACLPCSGEERIRVAIVVAVATAGEVLGSLVLGLYVYRLDNLPLFVPAGHGLIYLAGWRLSQLPVLERHRRAFLGTVAGLVALWGLVGLSGLPGRYDVAGAVGCLVVLAFLRFHPSAPVCAGVFLIVAFVELYGTWAGTWTWQPVVPGLGVPIGNPPSGAASGYVVFEMTALALGPWVASRLWRPLPAPQPITVPEESRLG